MAKRVKREKICGIYMWEIILPGKWFGGKYIGQSIDILKRQDSHKSDLLNDCHHNQKLQRVVNKYGLNIFKFSILMRCQESELNFWEKWFIKSFDTYKTKINFNLTEGGDEGSHNYRECELQNMETGEIVKCSSIKEFREKYNLNEGVIGRVLDGKSKFVGEWFNPKMSWRPKVYQLKDSSGNIHSFCKMHKFCDKYDLDRTSVCALFDGSNIEHRGWTLVSPRDYNYDCNEFSLISPDGEIFKGKNISEFARSKDLNPNCLTLIARDKSRSHKGWRRYDDGDKIEKYEFKIYEYKFVSPDGKLYITNTLSGFAREHNLEVNNLFQVYKGKRKSCAGWRLYDGNKPLETFEQSKKRYKLINPQGISFETDNLSKFARENNLKHYSLHKLVRGETKSSNGWKIFKENR